IAVAREPWRETQTQEAQTSPAGTESQAWQGYAPAPQRSAANASAASQQSAVIASAAPQQSAAPTAQSSEKVVDGVDSFLASFGWNPQPRQTSQAQGTGVATETRSAYAPQAPGQTTSAPSQASGASRAPARSGDNFQRDFRDILGF
ncbi:MAG: hypothetical protein HUK22_06840, partial [Thermoguttaceae bacterium]|nr:hypothetical protein [Thermoguttaceae bacterium]